MTYTQEQIDTALKASARRWSFRHEIIKQNGDLKGIANVIDASVANNDLADKVKRTGDYTLSVDNNIDFFKDRLRSFARLKMHDGNWHEWCVGTFHLTTSGKQWKLTKRAVQQTSYEEVARNLIPNSSPWDATGWHVGTGFVIEPAPWGMVAAKQVAPGASLPFVFSDGSEKDWVSGETVYAQITVQIPVGHKVSIDVHRRTGNNYYTGMWTFNKGAMIVGTGEPMTLTSSFTLTENVPAGDLDIACVWTKTDNGTPDAGVTAWFGKAIIDDAPLDGYFNGDMGEGQDYRYSWAGTPHASESVKERITYSVETVTVPAIDVIDVEAYDSLLVLDEDKVLDRYVVTAGTNYRDAVVTVLNSSGFTQHMIASTALTLPAGREWEPGTPKLKIINDLLSAINYRPLIMDPFGVPTSSSYQAPESAPPIWEYKVDRDSVILPGIDVELDLFNIPNAWVVSVSEPDRPLLTATKINDDPNSVLSTVNRGRMIVEVVKPDSSERDEEGNIEAATQEILEAKLDRIAQEASQQYQTANFETGLMPFHGSGDVCLISYGEGLLRFREHEWKMELKAGGKMSHKFRRVVVL